MKYWPLALLLLLTTGDVTAAARALELRVHRSAAPVRIRGTEVLVYELHLTSVTRDTLILTRLEVKDAGQTVADFRGRELEKLLSGPAELPAGGQVVAYFWLPVDGAMPRSLHHHVEYTVAASGERGDLDSGVTPVWNSGAMALGPPLRGGPWVAIYDPFMARGHRRVFVTVDGRTLLPGRFAVDFMKIDDRGKLSHDDSSKVANWNGYGADVLAVANGVVAATRDDVPESATISSTRHPLAEASGNYISLSVGPGRYVFYEHLQPGSVRVKPGERVRAGQVIAALGYTGDSTGPHLHLHVATANSDLAAEGIPFVLDSFRQLGRYDSMETLGKEEPWSRWTEAETRKRELPAANAVIEFP